MMKKYFFVCVVLIAMVQSSFAQLQVSIPFASKPQALPPSMRLVQASDKIIPASNKIVPVHINVVKPVVVSLDTRSTADKNLTACAAIKKLLPTLILKADRINKATARVQWETKYAFYATGFDIERSAPDSFHFEPVNFSFASKGTAFKKKYQLPDNNDLSSVSYYRIKQHNGDTGFVYSNMVSIKGFEAVPLNIYPVPAKDKVWIDVSPKQNGELTIMLYDHAGKILKQQVAACFATGKTLQSIDISEFAAGLYQIKILLPDKTFITGKFVKQ